MSISNHIQLNNFRYVSLIFEEIGDDIADSFAQTFKGLAFGREAGNIGLFNIPNANFMIPSRSDDCMSLHDDPFHRLPNDHAP